MRRTPYLPDTEVGLVLRDPQPELGCGRGRARQVAPLTMRGPAAPGLALGRGSTGAMTVDMRARRQLDLARHIELPGLPPCACGLAPEVRLLPRGRAHVGHCPKSRNSLAGRLPPEGRNTTPYGMGTTHP